MKGTLTEEGTVEFDFHDVMYREVKVYVRTKSATGEIYHREAKDGGEGEGDGQVEKYACQNYGKC